MEQILEKIKKLMRHAESAKQLGSYEEAEAFTLKIQELMLQYNIQHIGSFDEVDDDYRKETYDSLVTAWWHKILINSIAEFNFTKVYSVGKTRWVVGSKMNIENTVWLFNFIKTKIWYAAYYETRKQGKKDPYLNTGQFKKNFYYGAIHGFKKKLDSMKAEQPNQVAINALMVTTGQKANDYIRSLGHKIGQGKNIEVPANDGRGFSAGFETGKNLNIGKPLAISQKRLN